MSVAQDAQRPRHNITTHLGTVKSRPHVRSILGGATIQIDFAPGSLDLPQDNVVQWIHNAATAVTTYYGRFPVATARVLVVPAPDRSGVLRGTTWGGVGGAAAFTRMVLGQHTTATGADRWTGP